MHNELDLYQEGKLFAAFREPSAGKPSPLELRDARRISRQEGPTSGILEAPAALDTPGGSSKQRSNPAGVPFADIAWPELDEHNRAAAEAWVRDTINDLKFNEDVRRIDDTEDASVETCDWILSKSEFQNWNAPLTDSIMFVQGGPGLGKSVLAKFLVQRLKDRDGEQDQNLVVSTADQDQKPIVAHFFPRGTEYNDVDNSPKAILLSILYQIWKADPLSCCKVIRNLFNRFNQSRNLDFYWTLFNDVRGNVTRDLYCVVDGLDECIKEFKPPRRSIVDDRMEGFLKRLCDVVHGPCTQEKASCTKILITTRPTVEVNNATRGRGIVLEIQESDTISAVGKFIDVGVRLLDQLKHLTPEAQDFIKKEITQISGHVFQTAQTALRKLRNGHYDLENQEVVSRALLRVNSRKSDDAYEEVLEILQSATPQDRVKAARIIRILFFLQRKISLQGLAHALIVDDRGFEPVVISSHIQSTLDAFIRSYLALLVKIDNENMVSLQHQTIRDYFQNLSVDKWQVYSCAERKGGHLQLALICIRYMIFWCGQSSTQEKVETQKSEGLSARYHEALFISYASHYWTLHTREAGELLNPHMEIVNTLLGFNSHQDHNKYYLPMLSLRWSQGLDAFIKDKKFVHLLPGSFLAHNDLINVLRAHTYEREKKEKGPSQRLMFWRPRVVSTDTIEADSDLNIQNKDGFGLTPLYYACQNGHLETVRLLLDCGALGKVYDNDGDSPFSLAVKGGWEELAEMLIERKQCWHDPKRKSKMATLHLACIHGMSKVVRHLVGTGFDINAESLGWTPVHHAAYNSHMETLDVLLGAGALPDSVTILGHTPLHLAAEKGYLSAIEMLFKYKVDMESVPLDSRRQSPHHKAVWNGHLDVLRYLEARCKRVPPDYDGDLPIHWAAIRGHLAIVNHLSEKSNLTALNKNKRLPIHYAAANGHLEIVQRLLQLGRAIDISIDVKCRDISVTVEENIDGLLTPLYVAVARGHPKVAEYLISEGANLNTRSFRKDTLLHEAAAKDLSETFKLLLRHKLDPFEANDACETPLHFAAGYGSSDIVDIYMGMQDVDVGLSMLDAHGNSALIWAIKNKHTQIAERLISKGIDVHLLGSYQRSSLLLSLHLEDMTVFRTLLDKGVDVNITDVNKETALHWAAARGNWEACKMLIDRGANVSAERHFDRSTALHSAASRHNVDTVLRLLNAGADPFQRDIFGACIMDFVTTYQPMLDLLRKYRENYQPPPREEQINILKQVFRAKLREMPVVPPTEPVGKHVVLHVLHSFVRTSWLLKDYDIARTGYGYCMTRSADWTTYMKFWCDDCLRDIAEESLWKCKQCPYTDDCNECYAKRSNGIYSRGCSVDHEYLEIGGEEWRELEKGKVNTKGQTLWEWLAELKEIHLVENDDALVTSSTLHFDKAAAAQVNGGKLEKIYSTGDDAGL